MKVTFGALRGQFEVTLSISTSNFMCDACVMHTCTGLVGPKRGKVKKLVGFESIFEGVKGATSNPRPAARKRAGALSGYFGVDFWCTRVLLDYFGITSGLLCGSFGYMKVIFKKHSFFK